MPSKANPGERPASDAFPFGADAAMLRAWQHGRTGTPIVDAGIRQPWHSGWMRNRVRMIDAPFQIAPMPQPRQDGEVGFEGGLPDASPATDDAFRQRTAGRGADAASFLRFAGPGGGPARALPVFAAARAAGAA